MEYIEFFFSAEIKRALFLPKIFFGVISVIFIAAMVYFVKDSGYFKIKLWQDVAEFFSVRSYGTSKLFKRWDKIKKRLDLPPESEHKLAIIEADGLLNEILERMGYKGETLGERLKQLTQTQLSNIEEVWEAHKTRNNIVHDPDYRLSLDEARQALEIYEKALQNLQAL